MDDPIVRLVAARRQPEQGRLAGAVRPDEADPIVDGDRGRDVIEDDEGPDLAMHVVEAKDRHPLSRPQTLARRLDAWPPPDACARPGSRRDARGSRDPAQVRRSPPRPAAPSSAAPSDPARTASGGWLWPRSGPPSRGA